MKTRRRCLLIREMVTVAVMLAGCPLLTAAEPAEKTPRVLPSVAEARGRAELLHETFHAVLQVVHHQYYREDEGLAIPAATLRKVFAQLATRNQVEIRWLAVNAAPMNQDHVPRNDFERRSVAALTAGGSSYEAVEGDMYRRVAAITLTSECLKCHVPNRSSTEDRLAGLSISMPILSRATDHRPVRAVSTDD
jgi:hypothetical protein